MASRQGGIAGDLLRCTCLILCNCFVYESIEDKLGYHAKQEVANKPAAMTEYQNITPTDQSDYPRVVEVWEASVRATHHFVSEADIEVFRPMVWDALPKVEHLLAVRDDRGQVVGFIGVDGDEVEMLFVHPEWRGRGIGGQLLTYAIGELGATRLDVNEQNEQALGFYRHMGFAVIGRSAGDSMGKPYPLLHMRLHPDADASSADASSPRT